MVIDHWSNEAGSGWFVQVLSSSAELALMASAVFVSWQVTYNRGLMPNILLWLWQLPYLYLVLGLFSLASLDQKPSQTTLVVIQGPETFIFLFITN